VTDRSDPATALRLRNWDQPETPIRVAASIADQGSRSLPAIVTALVERISSADLGYHALDPATVAAIEGWLRVTQNASVTHDELLVLPFAGRAALAFIGRHALRPTDVLVVPSPVYPGMFRMANSAGAELIEWPFVVRNRQLSLRLEDVPIEKLRGREIVLALCQPNNPTGLFVEQAELRRVIGALSAIATVRLIVSDELHGDLVHDGQPTSLVPLARETGIEVVALRSVGKTFNVSGLGSSYAVATGLTCAVLRDALDEDGFYQGGVLSDAVTRVALTEGAGWLEQLRETLRTNAGIATAAFATHRALRPIEPRASFLLYVPFDPELLSPDALRERLAAHGIAVQWFDRFGGTLGPAFRYNISAEPAQLRADLEYVLDVISG
jgi:cysteine-S-conjugate beta-lyase